MATLILRCESSPARSRWQQDVPSLVQAQAHARLAAQWGYDEIRVVKPGHTTDYKTADVLKTLASKWAPHIIAHQPWAEHHRLGATVDDRNQNWPGASLAPMPTGPIYNPEGKETPNG